MSPDGRANSLEFAQLLPAKAPGSTCVAHLRRFGRGIAISGEGDRLKGIVPVAPGTALTPAIAITAVGHSASAVGQVASVNGAGDEMKVLCATPSDIAQGNRGAVTTCNGGVSAGLKPPQRR